MSRCAMRVAPVAALLLLAGCSSEELADMAEGATEVPDQITLTLAMPEAQVVNIGTRADDDPALRKITVMCFDGEGNGLSTRTYSEGWSIADGSYVMSVPIHKKTRSLQLVTNCDIADNATGASDPSALVSADAGAGVMWGRTLLSEVLAPGSQMVMLRQSAKISVSSSAAGFSLAGFGVSGTSAKGSVAPALTNYDSAGRTVTAPTLPAGNTYTASTGNADSNAAKYVFETPVSTGNADTGGMAKIVVKGTYNNVAGYYPVAFRTRAGSGYEETPGAYQYQDIPVLRNHHYKVEISEVRAYGFKTYEEACKAAPDNRITVLITDIDDAITSITTSHDYMLGISGDIGAPFNGAAEFVLVTSYPGALSAGSMFGTDQSWVKTAQATMTKLSDVSGLTGAANDAGVKYKVNIPLDANMSSTDQRQATISVTVADMRITFRLTQGGFDYRHDRVVALEGLGTTINDYFSWVENTCKGMKAEQNRGKSRDDGLVFPAVPAYTLSYKIPAKSGDSTPVVTGNFNVVKAGDVYLVTAANTSSPTIGIGSIEITNGNTQVKYPLYQTGYFHELKNTTALADLQREGTTDEKDQNGAPMRVFGWYYYEVVKTQNGNQYILDRNLGASSNAPFVSTYAPYRDNSAAIGAYFKIATAKSSDINNPSTILPSLGLDKFTLPTRAEIDAWNVSMQNPTGTTAATAKTATITTTGSQVEGGKVYLPHGGYYDGDSPKYITHANIWTRTLLSGNQGFSPQSPEFGFWYIFFDCFGTTANFSNLRFCNGTAGQIPEDPVYKYLPLRLVWKP